MGIQSIKAIAEYMQTRPELVDVGAEPSFAQILAKFSNFYLIQTIYLVRHKLQKVLNKMPSLKIIRCF
ncbi:MAG: hypothetical protein EBT51_10460 [Flavobacteriaceae bacterium]|nr:hypothetical protein [Flavobacteriaceae bacterium]